LVSAKENVRNQVVVETLPSNYNNCKATADIHITENGRLFYSSERNSSTLSGFKVNANDGTLALIEFIETEDRPLGFNINSSSKYLFVVD
jgi:6-phosphogluconolactonase